MLRAVAAFASVLMTLAPMRAHADEFESYDPAVLAACLESAGAASGAMRQCIGLGARACIDADGPSTMAHVLCSAHEADDWESRMDAAARAIGVNQPYRDPVRLAEATKAWRSWREAECEYWAYQEGGGSGEQVDRAQCWVEVTAARAIRLIATGAAP